MINTTLLQLLQSTISISTTGSNGNYNFYCPNCHHHKRKLVINIDSQSDEFGYYNC